MIQRGSYLIVDTILHNGKIFVNDNVVEAGIAINDEKIYRIAKTPNLPKASEKINLNGKLIIPGLIDVHVHLRDEGKAYKEDFSTGTMAAAAGGITTVLDMPNNRPVTMNIYALKERMQLALGQILVNVGFYSAFPENFAEIPFLVKEGIIGFKLFLNTQIGGIDVESYEALQEAFQTLSRMDVPIAVHAEDKSIIEEKRQKLQKMGRNDFQTYLEAHPAKAEEKAVQRVIKLVEETEAQVHFCHVSLEKSLKNIIKAKQKGFLVTCEVTPHHLLLSAEELKKYGAFAITTPCLRREKDVEALWRGIKAGWVDVLASDHAPHSIREKNVSSIWEIKPGIPGIETLLPLMLNQVNRGRLTLGELVKLTSENPAKIFRLNLRGLLKEGFYADLTIIDLKAEHYIDASKFYSKAKYSPFDGWKIHGKPVKTFVNGELVIEDGEIMTDSATGKLVRREIH